MAHVEERGRVVLAGVVQNRIATRMSVNKASNIEHLSFHDEPQIVSLVVLGNFLSRVLLHHQSRNQIPKIVRQDFREGI